MHALLTVIEIWVQAYLGYRHNWQLCSQLRHPLQAPPFIKYMASIVVLLIS